MMAMCFAFATLASLALIATVAASTNLLEKEKKKSDKSNKMSSLEPGVNDAEFGCNDVYDSDDEIDLYGS